VEKFGEEEAVDVFILGGDRGVSFLSMNCRIFN
jgi:hypothetical protein